MSGKLVLGAEVEFSGPREGLRFEAIGPVLLYRAIDPDLHSIGIGVGLHASMGRDGSFEGMEVRAIIERRARDWWLQTDLILRRANDDGSYETNLAYAASVQRSLGSGTWLGFEASGQVARLGGETALAPAGRHYAGPSLTTELPIGGTEVELGLAWLQRLRGIGAGSGPRIFAQFVF